MELQQLLTAALQADHRALTEFRVYLVSQRLHTAGKVDVREIVPNHDKATWKHVFRLFEAVDEVITYKDLVELTNEFARGISLRLR